MLTHLEFTFLLATCNLSTRTYTTQNPFTGEILHFPIDDGFNEDEVLGLRHIIQTAGFVQNHDPDSDRELSRALAPTETLRLLGEIEEGRKDLQVEITVIDSIPFDCLDLILTLARAGNCALMSGTGTDVGLLSKPTNELVAQRWPEAIIISTRDELREWLEKVIRGRRVRLGLP